MKEKKDTKVYGAKDRECPVCGKNFIPAYEHIYKRVFQGLTYTFCGWNCMRAFEKDNSCIRKVVK